MSRQKPSLLTVSLTASLTVASNLFFLYCASAGNPAPKPTGAIEDDELLVGRADQYSKVVDKAVGFLVRGDVEGFRAMLSQATVESENRGAGAVDTIIKSRFIPFFSDFTRLTDTVSTLPTHDAGNNPGLAIFRTFETTSGQEKPFVIYVINQRGNYVVGNLLINKTFEDIEGPARSGW